MPQSLFAIPEPTPFAELLSLRGKTAIMTGGGRGLGKYVVRRFAEAGANVVFCARHADQLQAVAEEYADLPGQLLPVTADISVAEDREKLVKTAVDTFGGIDILVNCAAIYPPGGSLGVDEKTWDSMHDIDTKATFFLSTAVVKVMIEQGRGGRIINFLSTAYVNAAPMFSAYAIAKAGVWEMTRVMAKEFAQHRITVNCVTPGATLTEEKAAAMGSGDIASIAGEMGINLEGDIAGMFEKIQATGGMAEMFKQRIPMGRMGYPEDLANAVLYLAGPMASYVTGQNIVVDGGQMDNSIMPAGLGSLGASTPAAQPASSQEDAPAAVDLSGEPDPGLAGLWKAEVETPMGRQEVEIDAAVDGSDLTGTMLFMGKRLDILEGKAAANGFSYQIKVKVMMKMMEASVSGVRDGDTITGTVDNPMGSFAFKAIRA